jgi:transcriptional regulator with XRE-family HTH domain
MTQTEALIDALKRVLRQQQITYARVATQLELSEPSVKRLFSKGGFTLERLERICDLAGVPLAELAQLADRGPDPLTQLTLEQEYELLADPKLVLVAFLSLNHWQLDEMVTVFEITKPEAIQRLIKLDRLGMIELMPGNRVRRLVSRNFTWLKNGPVHAYFEEQVKLDFLDSRFTADSEHLRFVGALMSRDSILRMHQSIERLAAEIDQYIQADADLPLSEKHGVGAVFAIRPWELPAFRKLKRST